MDNRRIQAQFATGIDARRGYAAGTGRFMLRGVETLGTRNRKETGWANAEIFAVVIQYGDRCDPPRSWPGSKESRIPAASGQTTFSSRAAPRLGRKSETQQQLSRNTLKTAFQTSQSDADFPEKPSGATGEASGRPLNVLAVVERYPPVLGSDRRIIELLSRLEGSFRVSLLVVSPIVGPPPLSGAKTESRFHVLRLPESMWRRSALAPAAIPFHLLGAILHRPPVVPDVVVANHPSVTSGLIALALSRLLSVPLVVDFNDLIAQYTADLLGLKSKWIVGWLFRIQSLILSHAAGIVLVTQYLESYLPRSAMPIPFVVIPNGACPSDIPDRHDSLEAHVPFRLAYAGRFEPWAGSRLLGDLMHELRNRGSPAELFVAGNTDSSEHPEGVKFVGVLDSQEVASFLSESDAVLVPFPPGPTSDAASPLKLFEAWAAGKPALASDVAGIREACVNQTNTILLPPDNPAAWADAVQLLMRNPELRAKMSAEAMRAASASTWEDRSHVFARFLEDVLRPTAMKGAAGEPAKRGGATTTREAPGNSDPLHHGLPKNRG